MAALTIADELGEMSARLKLLEEELAGLKDAHVASTDRTSITQSAIAAALSEAAERIESVTRKLNQTIGSGGVALG
jgi:cell division protein ZapA